MTLETTLAEWLSNGADLVSSGAVATVRIMGRRPTLVHDPLSPNGEFGWMYGSYWLEADSACGSHTLQEAIFRHLPECPNQGVREGTAKGRGIMPRWPTEGEALAALDSAALAWAKKEGEAQQRRPQP